MVKKVLKPEHQGHIDGMCAVYSVLNARKLLFDHSEKLDTQLFRSLCEAIPDLFPNIVYDGTEVAGISRLLDAAKAWTNHMHKRELIWSQPTHRKRFATIDDYFAFVRSTLDPHDGNRKAAIVGLGKPWDHWTVLRTVSGRRAFFFEVGDSRAQPGSTILRSTRKRQERATTSRHCSSTIRHSLSGRLRADQASGGVQEMWGAGGPG